jgi:hypothetical protein
MGLRVADVVGNKIGKVKFPNLVAIYNKQSAHMTTTTTSPAEIYYVRNQISSTVDCENY